MLYTPTRQGDRIRLYPNPAAARAHAGDGQAIHAVAVNLDKMARYLTPVSKQMPGLDAGWRSTVELHEDGSVTARESIPEPLFVN
jgi:hypothetical protein